MHAVDSDELAIVALAKAARDAGFGERVTTERRHLGRRPLTIEDLSRFDAVVLRC